MDKNKHVFFMRKLLREFYDDALLSSELSFKGGTAAMFFEGLPRFSTDLDFNLTNREKQAVVFERICDIVSSLGSIIDSADKHFGPVVVLDYGSGERNLKVEVSNRIYDNHYSMRCLGTSFIPVMDRSDMLTHKLCAMLSRHASRDVFDAWYFLSQGWPLNKMIVRERTGLSVKDFLAACRVSVNKVVPANMMFEIGELLDDSLKDFVRSGKLLQECRGLIDDYICYPVLSDAPLTFHSSLLVQDNCSLLKLRDFGFDPSVISVSQLQDIQLGKEVLLQDRNRSNCFVRLRSGEISLRRVRNI